jgi:hypothetical protein
MPDATGANIDSSHYDFKFTYLKSVWNKKMVLDFEKNEDQGDIPTISIPFPNIVIKGRDDHVLYAILNVVETATFICIVWMLYK